MYLSSNWPTRALCKAGLAARLLRPNGGAPVILLYHGVTRASGRGLGNFDGKHVHVDLLRRQLTLLRRSRRIVPLPELIDALRRGSRTEGMVALTFDDGYRNNVEHAAPLLADCGAPATFFLATGFIGESRWAWVDRLEAALDRAPEGERALSVLGERVRLTGAARERQSVLMRVKALLKALPWQQAEAQSREVEAELGTDIGAPDGDYRFMSWEDARELRDAGFEIGAHTVNHALLSRVPLAEAEREIIDSRSRVLAEIGSCSPAFCYPNGKRRDYTAEVRELCGRHFAAALSTEAGAARREELYDLRRVVVDNRTTAERLAGMVLQAA